MKALASISVILAICVAPRLAQAQVPFADYFGDRTWQNIGVRIVGSWVAASSILVLALSLQTPSG